MSKLTLKKQNTRNSRTKKKSNSRRRRRNAESRKRKTRKVLGGVIFSRHGQTLDNNVWMKTNEDVNVDHIVAIGIFKTTKHYLYKIPLHKLFCIVKNPRDSLYYIYYKSTPWNFIWFVTKMITTLMKSTGAAISVCATALLGMLGYAQIALQADIWVFATFGLLASSTLLLYVIPALLVSIAIYKGTKYIRHKYVNTGTSQSSIDAIEAVGGKPNIKISESNKSQIRNLFKARKQNEFCHWYAKTKIGYTSITIKERDFVCYNNNNEAPETTINNGIAKIKFIKPCGTEEDDANIILNNVNKQTIHQNDTIQHDVQQNKETALNDILRSGKIEKNTESN
jgi:hypothetical protein